MNLLPSAVAGLPKEYFGIRKKEHTGHCGLGGFLGIRTSNGRTLQAHLHRRLRSGPAQGLHPYRRLLQRERQLPSRHGLYHRTRRKNRRCRLQHEVNRQACREGLYRVHRSLTSGRGLPSSRQALSWSIPTSRLRKSGRNLDILSAYDSLYAEAVLLSFSKEKMALTGNDPSRHRGGKYDVLSDGPRSNRLDDIMLFEEAQ